MPLGLKWSEIAVRLLCSIIAGICLGLNRTEHGHTAGLRTSALVCLAACIAMVQVNPLLPLAGRPPGSFVMNDLMRLPLGILSGMGFIGAGAIVRRGDFIVGVTTAATMWLLTVLGLCFGGGQISLGLIGTALGAGALIGFKIVENRMKQDRQGRLTITSAAASVDENELRALLEDAGSHIVSSAFTAGQSGEGEEVGYDLRWRARTAETQIPSFIWRLGARQGVRITWTPQPR